jgi:signal transduction histidine kinase
MSDRDLAGRRLLAVAEEELRRVVLDIHDGPVQCLFAALGQLAVLEAELETFPDAGRTAGPLARAVSLLERSLHDIRQIVGALYAPEFASRALDEIAEEVVVQHEALTGAPIALVVERPLPVVAPLVKIALYRVLQEALANVRRHAGVDAGGSVRLSAVDGMLRVEIEDRGRGFEPPPLVGPQGTEREQHVGLRGMRDRAAMVGGTIEVTSRPGVGTRVCVCVPFEEPLSAGAAR